MKLNKTVIGLSMVLIVTPSWSHGDHGTNTVWKTADGSAILSGNGECVRAMDFASLGRNSCHASEVVEAPALVMPIVEAMPVVEAPVVAIVEKVEPAAAKIIYAVETHHDIVHFDSDSSVLAMEAKLTLNKMVEASRGAEQILSVQVVGHADTSGGEDYNLKLSERRVKTVVGYLSARGLRTSSSFVQGEAHPVFENGKENKAASRRAELLIKLQVKVMN